MFKVTSERLAIGLVFVVIGTLGCLAPTQSDTWWLLRAGREILQTGAVPLTDSYSYTASGLFWPNHEWLSEVIFYALYTAGRLPLLTLFCSAVILATWGLSWTLTEGTFEIRFLLFAAGLVPAATSWAIRPQVFSMALFMLTCALLLANRIGWLLPIFVLWTNLHGAVALGLLAVMAVVGADVITHRKVRAPMVLTLAGCIGATFASPLGARLWSFIPASMERSRINQLIEWQRPGFSPGLWPFWLVAVALVVATVLWGRRLDDRRTKIVAIALAALLLALQSLRNVPVFLLVAVPALTTLLATRIPAKIRLKPPQEHERVNAAIVATAAAAAIGVVTLAWLAPAPSLGWRPMKPDAVAAVRACADPLYNAYGDGGILIWFVPERRVFIDNRQDPYPLDVLRAAHRVELDGDYSPLFDQYGVRCAAIPPTTPVAQRLRADKDWTLTYSDDKWTVFEKRRL